MVKSFSYALIIALILGLFSFVGAQNVSAKENYTPQITSAKFVGNNKIKVSWKKNWKKNKYDNWTVRYWVYNESRTQKAYKGKDKKYHWSKWSSWGEEIGSSNYKKTETLAKTGSVSVIQAKSVVFARKKGSIKKRTQLRPKTVHIEFVKGNKYTKFGTYKLRY